MTLNIMICCSVLMMMVSTWSMVNGQAQQYTTPVPILKQINRHNEDGSYSYGYEGADGSFKIETKYANGEVYGKYGYVDDSGKTREVEYGATKRGFEPQGNDINVPPPTLSNNNPYPLGPNEVDDGQYREDPSIYYKDEKYNNNAPNTRPATNFRLNNLQPQSNQYYNPESNYRTAAPAIIPSQPATVQQHRFTQPQPYYQQAQPQYYHQPQTQQYYNNNNYQQHPALRNFDLGSGSYSINYTGRKR